MAQFRLRKSHNFKLKYNPEVPRKKERKKEDACMDDI